MTGRHLASGAKDHSNVVKGDEVELVMHDELQRYEEVKEGEEKVKEVAKEPKAQAVETAEPVKSKE